MIAPDPTFEKAEQPALIRDKILSIRRDQVDQFGSLIPIPSDLYLKAQTRLKELRIEYLESESREYQERIRLEAESITQSIAEIKEIRAELIWAFAWTGDGRESDMLIEEWQDYLKAREVAKMMRSEE